ncbi:MAG: thiol:disulfide interchange protein DsbA/DsbL [Candidatus Competibacteraceae bacterium]|jgi:thiol:disulfide interchange protein DsbA|nr:thiol:disulfide interchange protein DsbA/DsbL [Candidatus Competibacteraceae bacterium]
MMTLRVNLIKCLVVFFWMFWAVAGAESAFQEGTHYQKFPAPIPATAAEDKIEVVEVFWYGCPHCFSLEPVIDEWLAGKPENVEFVRIPAVFGRNWEIHARTFYAAEVLGVEDKIHKPLMEAIHAQKRPLNTEQQLAVFFAEQGVDKDAFLKALRSFDVETRLQRSQQLVRRYRITGVPAVVIKGEFWTNATMAGSHEKIFEVVDHLVVQESKTSG